MKHQLLRVIKFHLVITIEHLLPMPGAQIRNLQQNLPQQRLVGNLEFEVVPYFHLRFQIIYFLLRQEERRLDLHWLDSDGQRTNWHLEANKLLTEHTTKAELVFRVEAQVQLLVAAAANIKFEVIKVIISQATAGEGCNLDIEAFVVIITPTRYEHPQPAKSKDQDGLACTSKFLK